MVKQMSLWEVVPARLSQQQETDEDSWTSAVCSCSNISDVFAKFTRAGLSGKTCPVFYHRIRGGAFATLIEELADCGYALAWRVLDAQFFGVAQRRRRVFVVGHIGDEAGAPAAVLFERQSVREYPRAGAQKRKELTAVCETRPSETFGIAGATANSVHYGGQGAGIDHELCFTLTCQDRHIVCFDPTQITSKANGSNPRPGDAACTLTTQGAPLVASDSCVRKLTPLECERLQGFPDGWTDIEGASDNARYKALGNSMAVPVMEWLGRRIELVDSILKSGDADDNS